MHSFLRLLVSAAVFTGVASFTQAAVERTVEKSFPVAGAGTLRVETDGGAIQVMPSSDSTVRITARQRIRANSESEADELLKKLALSFEQNGNDVRVVARYERKPLGFRFGSWPPVHVDISVTVPAEFMTDLNTSGGPITLGDLNGKVTARTSGGAIKLGRMGAAVSAKTSGGSISLREANGPVELETSGGGISAGRVAGPARLSTSGGNIEIDAAASVLRAHTSGGNIRAAIAGPLTEECSLSTSGGNVRVTVNKSAAFRLDASTSGGGVEAEGLTLMLESAAKNRNRMLGNVNGGGPLLKLRSSGGSVSVRAD